MDKKRAIINISFGIFFKIILLILAVITKSYLVKHLGDEANGLYSLYTSIIGFLAVANLGIGTAITFNMYKPIVDNDHDTVSALYHLYKKFYLIIFIIILVVGVILTPFVPLLAKGSTGEINIYITYLVFLISVSISYLYAHKTSLINAYKDNYISTLTTSLSTIIEGVLQIVVIILTKNFLYFLLIRILSTSLNGLMKEFVYRKRYKHRINGNKIVSKEVKKDVIKYAKGMMMYRIGNTLTSSFDGIIISAFVGVISLSFYSNYITVIVGLTALLNLIFTEITSIVGQIFVKETRKTYFNYFKKAYAANFVIAIVFYLGFIAISDNLITIIFGESRILEKTIVMIIGTNYFIQYMRRSINLFKTASGGFYNDRFRPFVEGVVNIILSIILVNYFGVVGVLIATISSQLIITYGYETYVLFNVSFETSPKKFYLIHYLTPIIFVLAMMLYSVVPIPHITNVYIELIAKGLTSVIVSFIVLLIIYIIFKPFRDGINSLVKMFLDIIKKALDKRKINKQSD